MLPGHHSLAKLEEILCPCSTAKAVAAGGVPCPSPVFPQSLPWDLQSRGQVCVALTRVLPPPPQILSLAQQHSYQVSLPLEFPLPCFSLSCSHTGSWNSYPAPKKLLRAVILPLNQSPAFHTKKGGRGEEEEREDGKEGRKEGEKEEGREVGMKKGREGKDLSTLSKQFTQQIPTGREGLSWQPVASLPSTKICDTVPAGWLWDTGKALGIPLLYMMSQVVSEKLLLWKVICETQNLPLPSLLLNFLAQIKHCLLPLTSQVF